MRACEQGDAMISMTIPGLTEFFELNDLILRIQQHHPEMLREGVRVESVYGGVAHAKFCGGRVNEPARSTRSLAEIVRSCNERGVACNVTFTNQFIDERALREGSFSIDVLRLLDEMSSDAVRNGVILYADCLDEYVRREFPALTRILSTTRAVAGGEELDRALERFDRVVLDYNATKDEMTLAALCRPEGLEVMANEYCTPHCPQRADHYRCISLDNIRGMNTPYTCAFANAKPPQAWGFFNGLINGSVFLRNEDICAYAERYGVVHFKIVGRGLALYDVIDSYLYYLIEPQYWNEVRDAIVCSDILDR